MDNLLLLHAVSTLLNTCTYVLYTDALATKDLSHVRQYLHGACTEWEDIGLELNLDPQVLDAIKANNADVQMCLTDTLKQWLKQCSPKPTWSALLAALKQPTVGRPDLASDIERDLKAGSSSVHTRSVQENGGARIGESQRCLCIENFNASL